MPVDSLRDKVRSLMPRAKDDLARMVSFRSVHDAVQFPPEECAKMVDWLLGAFTEAGLHDVQGHETPDGSTAVCDAEPPLIGGVPATVPFGFADADANADIINDLGCRADDGAGLPVARPSSQLACTRTDASFGYGFVDATTTVQLCLLIAKPWAFAEGDTIVAARGRDVSGRVGPSHEMVVRVGH